jgi:hypothetical protein
MLHADPGSQLAAAAVVKPPASASPAVLPCCRMSRVAELPEAVLADDLAVEPEGLQVAASHIDALPFDGGAADCPFRHPPGPAGEVIVVPIVNVRNALESVPPAPRRTTSFPASRRPQRSGPRADSNTQSSAKCIMIASRSCLLNPSSTCRSI